MILREYLYVDTPAVRAVLAQLDSGIVERTTAGEGREKKTGGGLAKFAEHSQEWSSNSVSEKSLGDYLFPFLNLRLSHSRRLKIYRI
ncbi:hypothetical protein SAMN06265174_102636 [Dietzia kunjamensis subsp. schimae]|uniref:Uncharacterized protein n=1 Tax=Dietzia kunjamensis subsp. schimae TaxID=498198 RepID=A0ABY1N0I0_9ACTN|nr:hypothetical protein [Dietzia kunjamensis]MBB1013961.1 hypothetical protein [Dietzia kunjamensis subsp. schimae]SMO61573.1 hypothetical protein SAMN06265174_102636 [Dietzia kunjamensis subsp. schimae]